MFRGPQLREGLRAIGKRIVTNTFRNGGGSQPPAVTMHVRGKRPVSELASALTDLDLVDAVVATNQQDADD